MEVVEEGDINYFSNNSNSNQNNNFIMNSLDQSIGEDDISYRPSRNQPKLVKNYILGEVLGEGAYGKVKDGMDSFTQKRVAVKILKRARLKKIPGGEASVLKEISITKKLHNKHIIKLIDNFILEEKGKLYIVYEYVGGGTLQQLLENSPFGKLPLSQCQFIFKQLIDAIEYIHSQKILHRDIKPDNILFTHNNVLKLSDFGVSEDSSQLEDFECLSRSYGSPAFQPPELTQFQQTFSPFKIDIWAMGVTLYLMTIGKFPFHGSNMFVLFENISKCNIAFPQDIDIDLQNLIKGILQVDHNQRFTLEEIKNHPWCNKVIDTNEEFVPLLPESKFLPLEMAYGDDEEEEELMFGYENDPEQISTSLPDNSFIHRHPASNSPSPMLIHQQLNLTNNIKNSYISDKNISLSSSNSSIENLTVNNQNNNIQQSVEQQPNPRSSPQPPLRNSSNRRPKITFESPVDKNKCKLM